MRNAECGTRNDRSGARNPGLQIRSTESKTTARQAHPPRDLKLRTKQFSLRAIRLALSLPRDRLGDVISRQFIRSGTSVGSNYRAAARARSNAEFLSKMGVVEEEIDECAYWMEVMVESGLMKPQLVSDLLAEANQLTAIVVASIQTARGRKR